MKKNAFLLLALLIPGTFACTEKKVTVPTEADMGARWRKIWLGQQ